MWKIEIQKENNERFNLLSFDALCITNIMLKKKKYWLLQYYMYIVEYYYNILHVFQFYNVKKFYIMIKNILKWYVYITEPCKLI